MDLQQAFIKVKSIKQENFLLDGMYSENRYWGWKAFNEDCNAIQTALTNHLADFGPSQEAPAFYETITADKMCIRDSINSDELVEVTPEHIRLRKAILDRTIRGRNAKNARKG